jgi:hypothetical protein
MVANVLGDATPSASVRLDAMEKEVAAMKGSIGALEGANADLRKENRALKEEVKVLADWSNDFDNWGKVINTNVERLVRKKAAEAGGA